MKIIIIMILLLSKIVYGEGITLRVYSGLNFSNPSDKNARPSECYFFKNQKGFTGGFAILKNLGKSIFFHVQTGMLYSRKSTRYGSEVYDPSEKYNYDILEFPASLLFRILSKHKISPFIYEGIQFGYSFNCTKIEISEYKVISSKKNYMIEKKFDFGLQLGCGIDFFIPDGKNGITIAFDYTWSVRDNYCIDNFFNSACLKIGYSRRL